MPEKKEKAEFNGERVITEFEDLTRDATAVQRQTLHRILAENADVEYLRELGLHGRTDPESFRACVPVVTHQDLEPYIARIADGDTSPVLTAKPVGAISLSSGTTRGKRKYLLFNDELFKLSIHAYRTSYAYRNRAFPVEDGKALEFIYGSRPFTSKGGLTATTATTNVYLHQDFKPMTRDIKSPCCSPYEVIFASPDFAQSLYCHLLCGLVFADDVRTVFAMFAHNLVLAFQKLELVWEELCHDIRHGVLSPTRVTAPDVRKAVSALLNPANPALADEVERKCAGLVSSNWHGLIPALWPNAKYVHGIMTGSMEHYVRKIRHYAGHLLLVAMDYGASEGMIGANVEPIVPPESTTFVVPPDIAYFEFIPLMKAGNGADGEAAEEPVGLTDVTVGEHYEVVVTTFAGLYRYRMGDVVKVAGFYNSTPKLKFVGRGDLTLSINIDKNTEHDVQLAVDGAADKILLAEKLEVVDYTSHADLSSDPGHYVVFWELNNDDADDDVLQRCCDELDRGFVDEGYVSSRKARGIGPLELRVLRAGTFQKVMSHRVGLGGAVNQFKLPRCVARSDSSGSLRILSDNAVKVFFSTAYN